MVDWQQVQLLLVICTSCHAVALGYVYYVKQILRIFGKPCFYSPFIISLTYSRMLELLRCETSHLLKECSGLLQ